MSEERFERWNDYSCKVKDNQENTLLKWEDVIHKLNEQQVTISSLKEENEQLRLELETHKHPLWSIREAEKKVNKLADSLADEIKKNGVLNEELNQLRIENMRLKKAEKINMEYAEQIVEENQKLRIAKNDLRIENEQLKKLEKINMEWEELEE